MDEGQQPSSPVSGSRRVSQGPRGASGADLAFFTLCAVSYLFYALLSVYPDLNLGYPFMGGDSWDWIANGLSWAGEPVRFSGRPPLLPWFIAALDRLSWLEGLPAVLLLVFHLACAGLYWRLRREVPRWAAWTIAAALLLNHALVGLALQVMADVLAASLLFGAVVWLASAPGRPSRYAVAGLLAGFSYLSQQLALLLPLPVFAWLVWGRRAELRRPALWLGAALFAAFPVIWHGVKRWRFGWWGDGLVVNWDLLAAPGPGALTYYSWAALSFAGAPLLALTVVGAVVVLLRRVRGGGASDLAVLSLGLVVTVAGFFVFLYGWEDRRFLVYVAFPAAVLAAEGLAWLGGIARPWLVAVLAAASLVWSAAPQPGGLGDPIAITVWPLPPVHLRVPLVGSSGAAGPEGGRRLLKRPPVVAWKRSQPARALSARRGAALTPSALLDLRAEAGPVVLLHPAGEGGRRDRRSNQLGNAVRKRVQFVPLDFLSPCFGETAAPVEIGRLAGATLYRWRPPGFVEDRLLAFPSDAGPLPVGAPPGEPGDAAARADAARAIAAFLEGRAARVVAFAEIGSGCTAGSLLPFLLEGGDLYVNHPDEALRVQSRVTATGERLRAGGLEARRVSLFGVPGAFVFVDPAG